MVHRDHRDMIMGDPQRSLPQRDDADALQRLTSVGTDRVQGFYFSPALPREHFTAWLAERRPLPDAVTG
jgi:hypothetical protein